MLEVVAGILVDTQKRVLIAERPSGKAYAGYWEFPGGKRELGETLEQTIIRELQEELGIDTSREPWQKFYEGHRGQEIHIHFLLSQTTQQYRPQGLEKQRFLWAEITKLNRYQFPEPNTDVLQLLMSDNRFLQS